MQQHVHMNQGLRANSAHILQRGHIMTNDPADKLAQIFREETWSKYTQKQQQFLSLSGIVDFGGEYLVRHLDSELYLVADGEKIKLKKIHTPEEKRGQGQGNALLKKICDWADKIGVELTLRAEPKALKIGLDQNQLEKWYRKHGFEGDPECMTRSPRSSESNGATPSTGEPADAL